MPSTKRRVRKLDALHQFDCLRANKAMMAWGVEARVPFLDLEFLDLAMGMDAVHKMAGPGRMEKAVLREAFEGALPHEILWRQKEQFSDGVGYGWIDGLKAQAEAYVSDAMFAQAALRFPVNPPQTKEAYWYRELFEREFPGEACARTVPGGKSHRLLLAGGDRLGPGLRGGGRSLRPRGRRRARSRATLSRGQVPSGRLFLPARRPA